MKTKNKYNYLKIIQQSCGRGWEDVSSYTAYSSGLTVDRAALKHDLVEYRLMGYPTRVIFRKELIRA